MATMLDATINLKDNFTKTLESIDNTAKNFQKTAQRTGREIYRAGGKMEKTGGALTKGLTLPIIGVAGAALKLGTDFEKTMSGVEAVTGATGDELESLELKAREMGKNTTKSSSEAAEAMEYMGLAGWTTKEIMEGIEPVLRLSEAGNVDLATASDLVTDSMSAMGIEVQDLDGYLDVVAQAARSSNTDVDEMMEGYLKAGGVLRGLEIPLEESAVAMGMLGNAGLKGSEGGNKLQKILTRITAPTGRAKKALDELGFTAFDSEGDFKGLDNVLFELKDSMGELDAEQQNTIKSMIAGEGNIDGFNALINGLDDSYGELTEEIGKSEGALTTMADIMNDNSAGSIAQLFSALQEVALTLYDKMRPAFESIIDKLKDFVDMLNDLSPEQQDNILKFVKLAATIGPVLLVVGKLTKTIGKAFLAFSDISAVITEAGGVMNFVKSPAMIVVGVLLALVTAGILIYKNWETIKAKAEEIFPGIQETIGTIMENVKNIFTGAIELVMMAWSLVAPAFTAVWETIKGLFETGMVFVVGIIDSITTVFSGIIDFVTGVFTGNWEKAWQGVQDIFGGIFKGLKALIKAPLNAVIDLVNGAIGGLNKISLPDWVPLIGGKGINIPLIPKLAKGTNSWGGGIAQVHERGGEIIDLPDRSRVYPHDKSVSMARAEGRNEGSGGGVLVTGNTFNVRKESDIKAIATALAKELGGVSVNMA